MKATVEKREKKFSRKTSIEDKLHIKIIFPLDFRIAFALFFNDNISYTSSYESINNNDTNLQQCNNGLNLRMIQKVRESTKMVLSYFSLALFKRRSLRIYTYFSSLWSIDKEFY